MPMIKNDGAVQSQAQGLGQLYFRFRVNYGGNPDDIVAPGGIVSSLTNSSGTYTLTLASGCRPSTLVAVHCSVDGDTTTALGECLADIDSYNAANGTITLRTITDDGDGTGTVEDLVDNTIVSVTIVGVFDSAAV